MVYSIAAIGFVIAYVAIAAKLLGKPVMSMPTLALWGLALWLPAMLSIGINWDHWSYILPWAMIVTGSAMLIIMARVAWGLGLKIRYRASPRAHGGSARISDRHASAA